MVGGCNIARIFRSGIICISQTNPLMQADATPDQTHMSCCCRRWDHASALLFEYMPIVNSGRLKRFALSYPGQEYIWQIVLLAIAGSNWSTELKWSSRSLVIFLRASGKGCCR